MSLSLTSPPNVDAQQVIDAEISKYEGTLSRFEPKIAIIKSRLLELKARRNNHSPISRLPTEILTEIMSEETRRGQSQNLFVDSKRQFMLAGVCRGWRAIALNTPQLWSSIDVTSTHLDGCLAMLKLSKSAPLHIRYAPQADDIRIIMRHDYAIATIMSHIRRIRTFEIDAICPQYLHRILRVNPTVSVTSLQTLRLTCRRPGFVLYHGNIPRDMPSLRILVLQGGIAGIEFPFMASLMRFDIVSPLSQQVGGQPISHLLQCLYSTPNLESLSVESLVPDMPSPPPTIEPIVLPKLSKLTISSQYIHSVQIFEYLRRPTSTVVRLCGPPSTAAPPGLTSLQRAFCHGTLGEAASVADATVTLTDDLIVEFALDLSRPSTPLLLEHFTLSFPFMDHSHMMASLASVSAALPLAQAPSLTISGFRYIKEVDPEWRQFLQPFRGVKSLCFNGCDDQVMFEGLIHGAGTECPLPVLEEIRFEDCIMFRDDGSQEHPSLSFDYLWGYMQEFLDERKELGICVDFYWDGACFTDLVEEGSDTDSLDYETEEEDSDLD